MYFSDWLVLSQSGLRGLTAQLASQVVKLSIWEISPWEISHGKTVCIGGGSHSLSAVRGFLANVHVSYML